MNSNKKLSAQAQRILDILSDGQKHCPISWGYADGHGKRLTDINRYLKPLGKKLDWRWCDCGRHTTKIKMRWIAENAPNSGFQSEKAEYSTPAPKLVDFKGNLAKSALQSPLFALNSLPSDV